jgi:uncharacterized protein (DUF1501 family)
MNIDDCRYCREFARSAVFRRAAAKAGAGLREIEPGMPLPAGTGLDRRMFLSKAAGLALVVYGASALTPGQLDDGIARAAGETAGSGKVIVSVFLPGGADGLSMLYPANEPAYRRLRPTLALKPQDGIALHGNHELHWHQALTPLARLHARGKVTVFPAIGYTHPDQSHFTSRHYWEVGALDIGLNTGWLGRYLDLHADHENPMAGLSLDGQLQPELASGKTPISTLASPADYRFDSEGVWDDVSALLGDGVRDLGALRHSSDTWLANAGAMAAESDVLRRKLQRFVGKSGDVHITPPHGIQYPGGDFPTRLATLAAMLHAGFPIQAVALTAPGSYDTHTGEAAPLADGLKQVAEALYAFQHDLEARRLGHRVLTLVWTEFGRRPAENASQGTDHGAAGVAFLIGTNVNHAIVGEFPGLATGLDHEGNLKETVDFRAVYSSLLEQWYGVDAKPVVPDAAIMPRYRLVKA